MRALFNNESLAWCAVVDFNPIPSAVCVLSYAILGDLITALS
jgi:hypothetical protein